MPNDAKLALVIGVGLVVAVAILFYHKDLVGRTISRRQVAGQRGQSTCFAGSLIGRRPARRSISAWPMGRSADAAQDRGDEEKPVSSRTFDASVHGLTGP